MVIYTGGTFDLFHVGHVRLLERCWRLAGPKGAVVVGLNTDDFVERFKGRRPYIDYPGRAAVLQACRFVSAVIPNVDGEDSRRAIEWAKPDIIAVGDDWAPASRYLPQLGVTEEWLRERGIRLVFLPRTEGVASSVIRAALAS